MLASLGLDLRAASPDIGSSKKGEEVMRNRGRKEKTGGGNGRAVQLKERGGS